MLLGTIVNVVAVLLGSLIGILVMGIGRKKEMSERGKRISDAIFTSLGLSVILIGITGAIKGAVNGQIKDAFAEGSIEFAEISTQRTLAIILSMVLGVIIGELIDIDKQITRLGAFLEKKFTVGNGGFAKGFVSCSILFCVGAMAINGSMQDAIGKPDILLAKSVIDGISVLVMSTTLGIGCAFSAFLVLLYQGVLTLLGIFLAEALPSAIITYMSVTGSLVITLIGTNMLGITNVKTANMIPAIFAPLAVAPLLSLVFGA